MNKIKVGFIGFGYFSKVRINILRSIARIELVGYFDPNVENQSGLARFKQLEDMFQVIDAVIISVPPALASKYVLKSLKANLHVFCEKPPAISSEELQEIRTQYLISQTVLAYGFNHRVHDSFLKIKEEINSQKFGKILWMRGRYGKEVDEHYLNNWRCDYSLSGGGIVMDQGIHLIDMMSVLAGGFDEFNAILTNNYLQIPSIEDNAFISMANKKNRISASMHSTITQWRYLFSLEIFLEGGSIILNGLKTNSNSYGLEKLSIQPRQQTEPSLNYEYSVNNSWKTEMDAFLMSIEKGFKYPLAGIDDAVEIMSMIEQIYQNSRWV